MAKRALIYGIGGQDGFYLSKLLSEKGYEVVGVLHKEAEVPCPQKTYVADFTGSKEEYLFPIGDFSPDEIYNLAGMSSPPLADANPSLALAINSQPAIEILGKLHQEKSNARFFQASSMYMFSGVQKISEGTPPSPKGAYGNSKLQAHLAVSQFRAKGVFACSGILFNHESPIRPKNFVTRKISLAAAGFSLGVRKSPLPMGNLDAQRDWGFAGDFVEAMWLMLQQKTPDDYVIATGVSHTVQDFCKEAFSHVGLDYEKCITIDKSLIRPSEINITADIGKISSIGWKPKTSFRSLVHMMVDEDVKILQEGGTI